MSTAARKVTIDLNTVDREKTYEPFVAKIGDREINFVDPADLDWKDLLDIEEPQQFLRYAVSPEDKEFLKKADMPGWKFRLLMEAYTSHYGLDSPGNGRASRL